MSATTMSDIESAPQPPAEPSTAPPDAPEPSIGSPTNFLKGVVGKKVIVRLTSGVDYRGRYITHLSRVSIHPFIKINMYRSAILLGWLHEYCP